MDDISRKIGDILSDPAMMEQIRSLGSMLGTDGSPPAAAPSNAPAAVQPDQTPGLSPDMLNMMMKLTPLLSSMNREDESTRLLNALRPFLSEKRQSRIDSSIRLLSLMRMLPMLKTVLG